MSLERQILEKDYVMKVFNTGRSYTEHGQIIAYCDYGNKTLFTDISRGIFGIVDGTNLSQSEVLRLYDSGDYDVAFGDKVHELRLWAKAHWIVNKCLVSPDEVKLKVPRYADSDTIQVKTLKGYEFEIAGYQPNNDEIHYKIFDLEFHDYTRMPIETFQSIPLHEPTFVSVDFCEHKDRKWYRSKICC